MVHVHQTTNISHSQQKSATHNVSVRQKFGPSRELSAKARVARNRKRNEECVGSGGGVINDI